MERQLNGKGETPWLSRARASNAEQNCQQLQSPQGIEPYVPRVHKPVALLGLSADSSPNMKYAAQSVSR
jgi:hypothetical protein